MSNSKVAKDSVKTDDFDIDGIGRVVILDDDLLEAVSGGTMEIREGSSLFSQMLNSQMLGDDLHNGNCGCTGSGTGTGSGSGQCWGSAHKIILA